ncbi:MAG: hypothetical protein E7294_02630 [Lachnospiraceae bacterium]|nr:hypothetical protein [Lachnospiraceae bacterium]
MNRICNLYDLKKDILTALLWMCVAFAGGMGLCLLIVKLLQADDPEITTIPLGGLMAMIAGGAFLFLYACVGLKGRFAKAICMSCTRRRFLLQETIESIIETLVVAAAGYMFGIVDMAVQKNCMGGVPIEFDILDIYKLLFTNPLNMVMIICVGISGRFLIGELLIRFGTKAFWVLWAVWMLCSLVPTKIAHTLEAEKLEGFVEILKQLTTRWNGCFLPAIAIFLSAVFYVMAIIMLRKQEAVGY